MERCGIFCKENGSKKELSVAGTDRIQTIIESNKRRSDGLHEDLASRLLAEKHFEVLCHRDCVSMYTSKSHIKRHLNKLSALKGSEDICRKTTAAIRIDNLQLQATLPVLR